MADQENNQTQDTSFGSAENQPSSASTTKKANPNDDFSTSKDTFSTSDNQSFDNKTGSAEAVAETAKETAKGLYDQAKNTAGQAYGAATKRATEVIEEKKGDLAGGLTSVADSIKQVGENLRETPEQNQITETVAKYGDTISQQIEKISGYFERSDVRDMVRDVENFARRNPAVFIGAAFAIGFLAARFLKSPNPKYLTQGAGQSFDADRQLNESFGDSETASNPS